MLSSIHPLGERARNNRWIVTALAFTVGSIAAGAAVGATLGWVGSILLPTSRSLLIGAGLLVVIAGTADWAKAPVFGPHRQVNEDWIGAYRGWVYGLGFGVELGTGVVTYVVTWGVWALLALEVGLASPVSGAIAGATFGAVRAVAPLAAGWIDRPSRLSAFNRTMARFGPMVARAAAIALVLIGISALALRSFA